MGVDIRCAFCEKVIKHPRHVVWSCAQSRHVRLHKKCYTPFIVAERLRGASVKPHIKFIQPSNITTEDLAYMEAKYAQKNVLWINSGEKI